jgi:diketogulonate reductase-like aldo/keto reductase
MEKTRAFHEAHGIVVMAYGALGGVDYKHIRPDLGKLLTNETVADVAAAMGCTPSQALIAYQIARGIPVAVKSKSVENMRMNLEAGDLTMSEEHVARLSSLDVGLHYYGSGIYSKIGFDPFSQ